MRVLITGDNEFTGDRLETGSYYHVEKDDSGTLLQNSLFHALLSVYFVSGCYSYPAKDFGGLKNYVKKSLGAGFESYTYFVFTGRGVSKREAGTLEGIRGKVALDENGERMVYGRLKSWSVYTKKERKECIDRLVAEMKAAGVSGKKFEEILKTLEENGADRAGK